MMRAIEATGAHPILVASGSLTAFDCVVLPGVGSAGPAMRTLDTTGLSDELRDFPRPLLGVCVGMQLLFDYSTEDDTECLGLIHGDVQRIDATPLPHIGWNSVEETNDAIFAGLVDDPLFYFVHSFSVRPTDVGVVVGRTSYGGDLFASAVRSGRVTGLQFHPERSGSDGLRVLSNFVEDAQRMNNAA
jgi:glutamine amidotransferase